MLQRVRKLSLLRELLESGAAGGLLLMACAVLALFVANSPLAEGYFHALHVPFAGLDLLHWINDGLMAIFFLFVGLEIKREFLDGQLSTWANRALPCIAAAGGVVVPGLIYASLNAGSPETLRGWAIPTATDIAFALGVLSLLGSRVPTSLKIFLATLAIVDDLVAVLIIAVFYTAELNTAALMGAALVTLVLLGFNRLKVKRLAPYLVMGVALWWLVLLSGVHATIAGVVLAMTIPLHASKAAPDDATSPLHRLEHALSPWVAFLVVPIFGFANAGLSFAGMTPSVLAEPVTLGVALGLFFGKQIGVFGAAWLAIRLGVARLPVAASWAQLYGVSLLCGIGFTMSLFIGLLAFRDAALQNEVKVGVLVGSLSSALIGATLLSLTKRRLPAVDPSRDHQADATALDDLGREDAR
ncbi:Na+/H+ antiporter NhaA [Caulobacter vibrioides]|uniref:Na(+)/H(+) antiporter NhaA n=2 Tax=Caulobacter vibrioides TaxID=155892 RepID=NHAA_CAUVC|nr:Na+/H+ antiporter NhaA [Caulobacter vibrioides]YP_002515834.1 Na+/H+ antiporter nhaA [Caulobacter vibrioides NA1000]Q9AAZ2.1 RecName: Full=Na(+)/H(+) antiporter NhaA; AltName: Full=Sodium/proton antiporter NhaA [Caulobacter vibrioides CB15]QBQ56905.1 Na+/H+ antiporter NhaA [synthetic Caulobacter sp. 'ethensis']AAK22437.1 Na+/H+ antiporter [Caulobacter vibrioides CB15]ACL93926.1 Na+/H+ antiporter nhaA [Caulobacter vibrioides NA1000]ATC27280.1 Na+/H+ antiporter NhaA [Caulobacter vibrioides]